MTRHRSDARLRCRFFVSWAFVLVAMGHPALSFGAGDPCLRHLDRLLRDYVRDSPPVVTRQGAVNRLRDLSSAHELARIPEYRMEIILRDPAFLRTSVQGRAERTAFFDELKIYADFLESQAGNEVANARGRLIRNQVALYEHVHTGCPLPQATTEAGLVAENQALVDRYGRAWGGYGGETPVRIAGIVPEYSLGLIQELHIESEAAARAFVAREGADGAFALNGLPFVKRVVFAGADVRPPRPFADGELYYHFLQNEVLVTFPGNDRSVRLPERVFYRLAPADGGRMRLRVGENSGIFEGIPDFFFSLETVSADPAARRVVAVYRTDANGAALISRPRDARPGESFRLRCLGGARLR